MTALCIDDATIMACVKAAEATGESVWIVSESYPGYMALDDGRVYSARKGRFMSPIRLGNYRGLQVVGRDGALVKRYLHRLLLEFATGCIPPGAQACHNNGNRHDNRIANLRWDTAKNNHADKVAHGTALFGEKNHMARLKSCDVASIRAMVGAGAKQNAVAKMYGVSPMTISRVVRGETWSMT